MPGSFRTFCPMKILFEPGGAGDANPTHANTDQEQATSTESAEKPQEPFPLQYLGETLEAMGRAICETERVPASLAGCCLLGILSASIGARLQVQSAPNRTTWGNLYILPSADSGSGKTVTYKHAAEPLQQFEAEAINAWEQQERPGFLAEQDLLKADMEALKKKQAGKDGMGRSEARQQMQDLKAKLQEVENALHAPALSCEDTSTERLAVLLAENDEQLSSLSADARGVVNNLMGRYTSGKATDEAIYLKAFSGDTHRVDRISRPPVVLKNPCLAILWLIQPDKLELLLSSQSLSDGGLLPRFLLCHTGCEQQEIGQVPPSIPAEVKLAYHALIRKLLSVYRFADCPATVQPIGEARQAMNEYFNSVVRRQKDGGDLQDIKSYASRWGEQAWRISVCLHAAKHGDAAASNQLALETVRRAIALADWFAGQQLEILSAGRQKARRDVQDKVLSLLADNSAGITARDILTARIKPDAESCRALLSAMEAAGNLSSEEIKGDRGGWTKRVYRLARK